ncbi:nucleotide pyrophosphohydrolase [Bacteroidota bacterium]|nr:nucleotide pyrophosphohydrolase [Bacteroidota bacterium]MDC3130332.1 nucleotide pyrophosphohydrolase [Bacteroidota bacterium]MDC3153741.1 nucleotide pyrophosphohydrolase [Bacteroidota bacterium]MDC3230267.1 nucleotide pyrophosphohydrolase [Bacteroidota bacterium]|tara:strand:- start:110 stop:433 length:324 start_codon:yes stop_codon:yes gene_type:complete
MNMKDLQIQVDDWINQYGVRYFNELTNMAILTEEVGELARVMSRIYGEQSFKENDKNNIGEELADILFVVLCIANQTNTDLNLEFQKKMKLKSIRDKKRHKNNPKIN